MRTAQAQSETKEKLLDAAQRLMLAKGFEAAGVEEICEAAGVTKGSFFHYFETKEHLGKALVERYVDCVHDSTKNGPFAKEQDPLKRVYAYLDFLASKCEDAKCQSGCLLGTFAQELSQSYPEIRKSCEKAFSAWVERFKADLDAAKARYAPKAKIDTKSLAEHFVAVLEGSFILAKAQRSGHVIAQNLEHFKRYLRTLLEGKD